MSEGISITEANSENSHPDWFSQLLDHQQTETILEVLQSQDVKNSTNENVMVETEADKVNAIQEALEAVQGMDDNINSADIVNQLSLILQLGLYQDPINEGMGKIDVSSTNDYWSNDSKDESMITPPSSRSMSPGLSDQNGDDSDYVVVCRAKGGKRLKSSKKSSKKLANVPVMERMTEEATEEEQRLLKIAIQKAHSCRSDSDSQMKEPKYECPSCGRIFTRLYNLKSHIRSHQNYRPFKCVLCPASFTRNHDLNRHERTHNNSKPFACKYCGKLFARKDALGRHEKMDAQGKKTYCSAKAIEEGSSLPFMGKSSPPVIANVNVLGKSPSLSSGFNSQDRIFHQNIQEHLRILGTYNGL